MSSLDRDELRAELECLAAVLAEQGFDVRPLVFEEPALEHEVAAVERSLDRDMPSSLRRLFFEVSRQIEFIWFSPDDLKFPKPFDQNFSGQLEFSLEHLVGIERGRMQWIDACFPSATDPYDAVWHDKFAFYEVGNGDQLALDPSGAVVYLSHDDGEGHGYQLASSLEELLRQWVPLACAGGEDWQWMPFVHGPYSGIDASCENAVNWRSVLSI